MAKTASKESWNERLRSAAQADGRSIYMLAKLAEIDQAQLRRWMRGDCGLGIDTAEQLGRVVGVDLVKSKKSVRKLDT